jgi:hypothetical protein
MIAFPSNKSEQFDPLSPIGQSYILLVKNGADKISALVVKKAKEGENTLRLTPIEKPSSIEIDTNTFSYDDYANKVMDQVQINFPSCKILRMYTTGGLSKVSVEWSQDFMNPTEMFSD